jgi:hypothetical protein
MSSKGFCLKCKVNVEIVNGVDSITSNGRGIKKGNCPTCNTKCNVFLKKVVEGGEVKKEQPQKPPTKRTKKVKEVEDIQEPAHIEEEPNPKPKPKTKAKKATKVETALFRGIPVEELSTAPQES